MADLNIIMNSEDDHPDSRQIKDGKASGPRPSHDRDFSSSSSRYATQARQSPTPSYAHEQRRSSSSSHALHSFTNTPSSTSPGTSSAASTSRRRSNTSIDSMDPSYGSGQGYPGSSSSQHMRPFQPGSGGDVPVKYTPVTGRLSRAKKGVPVHICEICVPAKTFTRAEHLRRHQLSHGEPDLPCTVPGCDKLFYRKDLLERHQQRHEQDREAGRPSQSHSPRSPDPMYEPQSMVPGMHPGFGNLSPNPSSGTSASGMSMDPNPWSPGGNHSRSHSGQIGRTSGDYMGNPKNEYIHGSMDGMHSSYEVPRTVPDPLVSMPQLHNPPDGYSSESSNISTPSSSQNVPAHTSGGEWTTHPSYSSIPREMQNPIMEGGGYSHGLGLAFPVSTPQIYPSAYEPLGMSMPYDDSGLYGPHPNTTVRSLSPHMAVVQSSETLVTSPSALPADGLILPQACGRQPAEALGLLAAGEGMPVSLSRAASGAIPAYLNVYWERVHPVHPIIHQPTFGQASEGAPEHFYLLRCAMAALATQFVQTKDARIDGHQLHAYAWSRSRIFTNTEDWTLPIMQTVLLCEFYARFRGRKKEAYRPSPSFKMLYQLVVNNQVAFPPISTGRNALRAWGAWVDVETRRRLLAACFLLDVHSMFYHEQLGVGVTGLDYSSPGTLPIPLTGSTADLWDAPSCLAWSQGLRTKRVMKMVNSISIAALTPLDIASASSFDAAILLATHVLQLPRRRNLTKVDLIPDASIINTRDVHIATLFSESGPSNTYLALHYTPLHFLLSVSGDSWVFNKKVRQASSFSEHQAQLSQWRTSGTAAVATVFAARALKLFLGLTVADGEGVGKQACRGISDYWGVYACALICWAFSHDGSQQGGGRAAAVRWIRTTAAMEPGQVQGLIGTRRDARGVVGVAREVLARDCLGGRNILYADAVNVLRKLEEGNGWKWF